LEHFCPQIVVWPQITDSNKINDSFWEDREDFPCKKVVGLLGPRNL
jgi:hypothetical protein